MLLCDTSGLLAFFDASDEHHRPVSDAVQSDPGPFIVSPYVLAELDCLLATRGGLAARLSVLGELGGGGWELPAIGRDDLSEARSVVERYDDQAIGFADASLVVLARRYATARLLTLDHRHFSVVRTLRGRPFELLPADG